MGEGWEYRRIEDVKASKNAVELGEIRRIVDAQRLRKTRYSVIVNFDSRFLFNT